MTETREAQYTWNTYSPDTSTAGSSDTSTAGRTPVAAPDPYRHAGQQPRPAAPVADPAARRTRNRVRVALALGIASILFHAWPLAVAAIIIGGHALRHDAGMSEPDRRVAKASAIVGLVGIVLVTLGAIFGFLGNLIS